VNQVEFEKAKAGFEAWLKEYGPLTLDEFVEDIDTFAKENPELIWSEVLNNGQFLVNGLHRDEFDANTVIVASKPCHKPSGTVIITSVYKEDCPGCKNQNFAGCEVCDGTTFVNVVDFLSNHI